MKPLQALISAIANEDFDEVELLWLQEATEGAAPLADFLSIADTLERIDEGARAAILLEILDEQLVERGAWGDRLDLVHHAGARYLRSGHVHETVLHTIEQLYSDRKEELELLVSQVGLDKGRDETPKLWDRVFRLKNLMAYQPGTVVAMKGKGVGVVVDVNLALQSLKVDLEKAKGLAVGFRAAGKMLEILPEGHILKEKFDNPERLEKMTPTELLELTLNSYNEPLTGAEVKEALHGIVTPSRWSSWWTTARKHPQVLTSSGAKQRYSWAESSSAAEEALWDEFDGADARKQLDLLRRAANQDPELTQRMQDTLASRSHKLRAAQPSLAFEIYSTLDRQSRAPEWSVDDFLRDLEDPAAFLAQLTQRTLREQACELIAGAREDWADVLAKRFSAEGDTKAAGTIEAITRRRDGDLANRMIDQALAQPRRAPAAFTWIAEHAGENDELRQSRALRLIRQVTMSLADQELSPFRNRLGELCDSGGTIAKALAELTAEEAAEAETYITEATALEDYRRKPMLNALRLRFPELRKQEEQPLYALPASIDSKRSELRTLLEEEIPANRAAIEEARALGDLRENFEYKSARQRHEYLSARASSLGAELERAEPIQLDRIEASEIRIGTCAQLEGGDSNKAFTILGPWESAPENGIISYESELAKRLLGSSVGDEIEIEEQPFKISKIDVVEL